VITAHALEAALGEDERSRGGTCPATSALVVRTLPNDCAKRTSRIDHDRPAPFFTVDALRWIVDHDVRHLLVDLPSIDRVDDEGRLTNHHLFWSIPEGTQSLTDKCRRDCSITEWIFVPDEVIDGWYALCVQLPPWLADAAPSRPVLYPLEPAHPEQHD
jgi:hypothetical protein